MSDRMAAEIEMGGPVRRRHVPGLIKAINAEGVFVGWEEALFDAANAQDLLDIAGGFEKGTLILADPEARYGYFDDLEAFLVKHSIGFNRHSEAKYEHEGEYVQFRPGMKKPLVQFATQAQTPVVPAHLLNPVRQALATGHVKKALRALNKATGPIIPPLAPLRITA